MNTRQGTMKHIYNTAPATRADVITWSGLALALIAVIAAALAGFGSRWGWWYFMTGFAVLRDAAIVGLAAAVISLVGGILVRHEHHPAVVLAAAAGILVGLVTAGVPLSWLHTAETMPRIHDITTDTVHPPEFFAIMPLRVDAENGTDYGGPAVAAQQRAGYPDIRPVILPVPASQAFKHALTTARKMGWRIVDANAGAGRIEAVATTFWFGFKDDIVVRITKAAGGSRVDIRSVSRVGLSDVGTNARRIRTFLRDLAGQSSIDRSFSIGF